MYQYLRSNLRYEKKVKINKELLLSPSFDQVMIDEMIDPNHK